MKRKHFQFSVVKSESGLLAEKLFALNHYPQNSPSYLEAVIEA